MPIAPREATPQEIWTAFDLAIAAAQGPRRPVDRTERRELLDAEGYHLGSTLPAHLEPKL